MLISPVLILLTAHFDEDTERMEGWKDGRLEDWMGEWEIYSLTHSPILPSSIFHSTTLPFFQLCQPHRF
jgi:hypothetical protein